VDCKINVAQMAFKKSVLLFFMLGNARVQFLAVSEHCLFLYRKF